MGLLDKLKNVFFEEEYVEVEEPEKKEPKEKVTVAKKIETPEINRKEEHIIKEEPKTIDIEQTKELEEPVKEEHRFPMNFDDKDFEVEKTIELEEPVREKKFPIKEEEVIEEKPIIEELPTEPKKEEIHYQEVVETRENTHQGLYEGGKEKEKQGFTPSPIISPIYGILNKNYTFSSI